MGIQPKPFPFGMLLALVSLVLPAATTGRAQGSNPEVRLLNVSYDPTRELYAEINAAFAKRWAADHQGQAVTVSQNHGASGRQTRAVLGGLSADVVTLGLATDMDMLAINGGLVTRNWRTKFPNQATPYTSTVVFLVRKGNPKGIKDWPDLARPGVVPVLPHPKTSAAGRLGYLSGWAWAQRSFGGDEPRVRAYLRQVYRSAGRLEPGARTALEAFTDAGRGDVLVTWESEALRMTHAAAGSKGVDRFEVVAPSGCLLAEPPVAVVDGNVDQHGTRAVAEAYLRFLYTPEGQEIAARHFYRPRLKEVAERHADDFPRLTLLTVADVFNADLGRVQARHFLEGGVFDQLLKP